MGSFTITVDDVPDDWQPTGDVVLCYRAIDTGDGEWSHTMKYGARAFGAAKTDMALGLGMARWLYRDYDDQFAGSITCDEDDV